MGCDLFIVSNPNVPVFVPNVLRGIDISMFNFIKRIFKRRKDNIFDGVDNLKETKIMPSPQLKKVKALGDAGSMIEGNLVSILSQNLLDLREICGYIIDYRNRDELAALDEAIQHLEHMLERPKDYTGSVEYRDEDADV